GHVHGVCHYRNPAALPHTADNLRGGGAGSQDDGVAVADEFRRGVGDATFFRGLPPDFLLKRGIVAEWLVEQGRDGDCPAVNPPEESLLLEILEIAPDGGDGDVQSLDQVL